MNKKAKRTLNGMKKVKNWRKGTEIGGKILNTGGDIAMLAGTVTGQPELIAAGGVAKIGGNVLNKSSKILKNVE